MISWALLAVLFFVVGCVCPDEGFWFLWSWVASLVCVLVVVVLGFDVLFLGGL